MVPAEHQNRNQRSAWTGAPFSAFAAALFTLVMAGSAPAIADPGDTASDKAAVLSITDVNIQATQLPEGCKFIDEERFVSPQANSLYELAGGTMPMKALKLLVRKSFQTIQCENNAGTVYYYEYKDSNDARLSRGFVAGLIWGESAPTEKHPELILIQNNILVVISSRTPETLRKLLRIVDTPREPIKPLAGEYSKPLTEEQDIGGGVLVSFPSSLKFVKYPMPDGATNFRVFGRGLKVAITGIPTGQPRASSFFVFNSANRGVRVYGQSPPFPPAQIQQTPKYNAAHTTQCSASGKYPVFPDHHFTCVTTLIISVDNMVLFISAGMDSLELDDYKAAMAALLAAH
jgi:hypothetical protein